MEAPSWQLKECRIYLQGAVMVEKVPFRAKMAPLLVGGAPYLLRRATPWTKRAPSIIRRAHSLEGRHPHNVFGAKMDHGLR